MAKMELILDQSLEHIASGADMGEVLQQHPAHADELEQLLSTAGSLRRLSAVQPSPAVKRQLRRSLLVNIHAYPRSIPQQRAVSVSVLFGRLTAGLAVILIALILGSTVAAQSALPAQPLYTLKLASEEAFRTVHPNKLAVDLALADRRIAEIEASAGDPLALQIVLAHYQQIVARLLSYTLPADRLQVQQALSEQRQLLEQLNAPIPPGLEQLFDQSIEPSPIEELIPGQVSPTLSPVETMGSSEGSTPLPAVPLPTLAPAELSTSVPLIEPVTTSDPSILPGEDPLPVDPGLPVDPELPLDPGLPPIPPLPVP